MKNKILKYFYVLTLLFSLLFTVGFGGITSEAASLITIKGTGDCNTDSGNCSNTNTSTMDTLRQALGSGCNSNSGVQYKVINGNDVDSAVKAAEDAKSQCNTSNSNSVNSITKSGNNGGVQYKVITNNSASCNTNVNCDNGADCNSNENCNANVRSNTNTNCNTNVKSNTSTNCNTNVNSNTNTNSSNKVTDVKVNGSTTNNASADNKAVSNEAVQSNSNTSNCKATEADVIKSVVDTVNSNNASSNCNVLNTNKNCSVIVLGSNIDSRCSSYLNNANCSNLENSNCSNIVNSVLCWSNGKNILCNNINKLEDISSNKNNNENKETTETGAEATTEETTNENTPTPNDAVISKAKECFDLINAERRSLGVAELTWDDTLYGFCGTRVGEIKTTFSHTRPDGSQWYTVMGNAYPSIYSGGGECLLTGANNAGSTFNGWKGSPGHYEILKSANYNRGAVATDGTNWVFIAAKAK